MSDRKKRKLSAILFADIVGYTAIMEKDEPMARQMLDKFHLTIITNVDTYQGQVVNNYGDGCLCTFDSAVDAVKCAEALQKDFQSLPKVPARIGLHSGDVFFEKENVFGDSVNIASRIESLGVAGSVLFSKRIKRDIANQTEFKIQSLGEFEFKNVNKSMEVFALANAGMVIPKPSEIKGKIKTKNKYLLPLAIGIGALLLTVFGIWKMNSSGGLKLSGDGFANHSPPLSKEVRQKRVAVMTFDNQTNTKELESFGLMASDWLTQGLMEVSEGEVVSAANVTQNIALAGAGNTSSEAFAKATEAEVVIQGRYYLQENQLIIHCNIIDAISGKVIHALNPIQKDKAKAMALLNELTQQILAYWALSDNTKYNKQLPKYEAYQEFLKERPYWNVDAEKVEDILLRAYQLDTTFLEPLIKLAQAHNNSSRYRLCDSLLTIIKAKQLPLTNFEQIRIEAIEASISGQFEKSANLNLILAQKYDRDFYGNVMWRFVNANKIQKAIEIIPQAINLENIGETIIDQFGRLLLPLFIYNQLEDFQKIVTTMDSVFQKEQNIIKNHWVAVLHLRALIQSGNMEVADHYLKLYVDKNNPRIDFPNEISRDLITRRFCNDLFRLKGKVDPSYLSLLTGDIGIALKHYINKDYTACLQYATKIQKANPDNRLWMGYLGALYARMGKKEEAKKWIQIIQSTPEKYNAGHKAYYEAWIQTALGQKEKAVALLKKAHSDGFAFNDINYQNELAFKDLFDYPPFIEFVKPK